MACRSAGPARAGCPAASGCGLDTSGSPDLACRPRRYERETAHSGRYDRGGRRRPGGGVGGVGGGRRPHAGWIRVPATRRRSTARRAGTVGQTRSRVAPCARAGGGDVGRWRVRPYSRVWWCWSPYLGSRSDPEPGDGQGGRSGDVTAGAARSPGLPATDGRTGEAGPAMPGLRPRQRPPSPEPTPSASAPAPPPPISLGVGAVGQPGRDARRASTSPPWAPGTGCTGGSAAAPRRSASGPAPARSSTRAVPAGGSAGTATRSTSAGPTARPERSASGSSNGVYTCGAGNGFRLAVAGSGESRTVQLYAGTWMARGRLDARLSTGGACQDRRAGGPVHR